jgi:hypothetical protein
LRDLIDRQLYDPPTFRPQVVSFIHDFNAQSALVSYLTHN